MSEWKMPDEGHLWSFCRRLLEQGGAIQCDYSAGKYGSYEEYSARLDEAARERGDELSAMLSDAPQPEHVPAAWLVEYRYKGELLNAVALHDRVEHYRLVDPDARATPLYTAPQPTVAKPTDSGGEG